MKLFEFRAQLTNPFVSDVFRPLGAVWGRIGRFWAWELEHNFYSRLLVDIDITVSFREDHQGLSLAVGLLGYGILLTIYDTRHCGQLVCPPVDAV